MLDVEDSVLFKTLCATESVMRAITKDQLLLELHTAVLNYKNDADGYMYELNLDARSIMDAFSWEGTPQGGYWWQNVYRWERGGN